MSKLQKWHRISGGTFLTALGVVFVPTIFSSEFEFQSVVGLALMAALLGGGVVHIALGRMLNDHKSGSRAKLAPRSRNGAPADRSQASIPEDFFDLIGRHAPDRPNNLLAATTMLNSWLLCEWGVPFYDQEDEARDNREWYDAMRQASFLFTVSVRTQTELEPGWSDTETLSTVWMPLQLMHLNMPEEELEHAVHAGMKVSLRLMSPSDHPLEKWLEAVATCIDAVTLLGNDDALRELSTLFATMPHVEFPSTVPTKGTN